MLARDYQQLTASRPVVASEAGWRDGAAQPGNRRILTRSTKWARACGIRTHGGAPWRRMIAATHPLQEYEAPERAGVTKDVLALFQELTDEGLVAWNAA